MSQSVISVSGFLPVSAGFILSVLKEAAQDVDFFQVVGLLHFTVLLCLSDLMNLGIYIISTTVFI